MENRKLTVKQRRFADYYIGSGNATESAIKAGYSKRTATETGYENLRKPHIAKYIHDKNEAIASDRIADMQEVKEFWTNTMRDEEADLRERLKASEHIAKTNGAFLDRVEHSGTIDISERMEYINRYLKDRRDGSK